jgi:hypothetical protein
MTSKQPRRYQFPASLAVGIDQRKYERWLHWRAVAHVKRDRLRGNREANVAEYKQAIHSAVIASDGLDPYTGETLDWSLIGTYDNVAAERGGQVYKARFALMPSVDHVTDGLGPANFKICSWRSNDSKSDLSYRDFVELCRKVVEKADLRKR